jgi:hypothetical protein
VAPALVLVASTGQYVWLQTLHAVTAAPIASSLCSFYCGTMRSTLRGWHCCCSHHDSSAPLLGIHRASTVFTVFFSNTSSPVVSGHVLEVLMSRAVPALACVLVLSALLPFLQARLASGGLRMPTRLSCATLARQ